MAKEEKHGDTGSAAIIHTTYGDIHMRLFPDAAPKAVENFVTHSKNGYYNNVIFHRVIRKFMIQVYLSVKTMFSFSSRLDRQVTLKEMELEEKASGDTNLKTNSPP
jgi:cyclophilin family peptidyl-prolyl cis-trans isomerase